MELGMLRIQPWGDLIVGDKMDPVDPWRIAFYAAEPITQYIPITIARGTVIRFLLGRISLFLFLPGLVVSVNP